MGSIAVVGSVAYDSVETPFGKVTEALGGAATYFSIAAAYFTEVRLAAPVGNDFRQQDVSLLESRNIDLAGLEVLPGKTFRWAGKYGYDLNDCQTLDTQLNVLADFGPTSPNITGPASISSWAISTPTSNGRCCCRSGSPNWWPATP